ncbi:hypothetical protein [Yinghuangia sp. YIM S09857]|uniref:hypothetical protein n=1 Tax=Yinghuangia sp. YIM S09857 TaxID=3436929 RepID=UPI003F52E138
MSALAAVLVVALAIGSSMAGLGWLAVRARRRGVAGSALRAALFAHDEALHGTAHDAHVEIQAAAARKSPVVSPDDPWHRSGDLAAGRGARVRRPARRRTKRRFFGPRS